MTTDRHRSLDGLRGVAVMGILLMNVTGFALPSGAYFNPRATGAPSPADLAIWFAAFTAADGKMRALFSILFGASTVLIVRRAEAAGRDGARIHLARMGTLALFGVVHGLLWPGDILLHYAIVGVAALPLTMVEPRQRVRIALLLLAAQALIQALLLLGDIRLRADALAPGAAPDIVARWRALAAGVGIGPARDVAAEVALHRGPWPALLAAHARDLLAGPPFVLVFDGLETLAYMALGMTLLPMLANERRFPRAAPALLAAALATSAALGWGAWAGGFDTLATFAAATLGGVPLRPAIAIGYAAIAVPWLARAGAVQRRLAAVGRLAFSNYLLTTLAMVALFDGAGLYGSTARATAYLAVPPVWVAMLAWSPWWTARFRHGPLEWCWRSLARGRPVTMRKAIANMKQ